MSMIIPRGMFDFGLYLCEIVLISGTVFKKMSLQHLRYCEDIFMPFFPLALEYIPSEIFILQI